MKLLVPVVPPTFYAAGLNYAEHVREAAEKLGLKVNLPTQPDVGYRANNALIAHGETIVIPKDATELVQYEGELVAVIGRKCKHLTRDNALSAVLGWTIGNDVSERTWQKRDRTLWRAKNTDTFKPMGPWIETDVKLDDLVTKVRLNGKELIDFQTNHMVFGVVDFLVAMTRYLTLYPGDVVWMGTEGATANMKHGDVVRDRDHRHRHPAQSVQRDQSYVSRIESGERHASPIFLLEWANARMCRSRLWRPVSGRHGPV